jgi:CHAT domain-containing protein/Tfp pilus assembly protein PilF
VDLIRDLVKFLLEGILCCAIFVLLPNGSAAAELRQADSLYSQAKILSGTERHALAAAVFQMAIESEKTNREARAEWLLIAHLSAGVEFSKVSSAAAAAAEHLEEALSIAESLRVDLRPLLPVYGKTAKLLEQAELHSEALELYERGRRVANVLGITDFESSFSHAAGRKLEETQHFEQARLRYQRALEIAIQDYNLTDAASALSKIATTHKGEGNSELAETVQRAALLAARKSENTDVVVTMLNNLGKDRTDAGDYETAVTLLEEAVSILGSDDPGIEVKGNLAAVYAKLGRGADALEVSQDALSAALSSSDSLAAARMLALMAGALLDEGRVGEAAPLLDQALALTQRHGRPRDLIRLHNGVGRLYSEQGQFGKAIGSYRHADMLSGQLGESRRPSIIGNIGSVFQSWAMYDSARVYYDHALGLHRDAGDSSGVATTLNNIGSLLGEEGRHREAVVYHLRALPLSQGVMRARIFNNLAVESLELDDFERVNEYLIEAWTLYGDLGNQIGLATVSNNTGRYAASVGLHEKSVRHYEQALEIFSDLHDWESIATVRNNLGFQYYQLGNFDSAVEHLVRSVAVLEELRLTATREARREYFTRQLSTYELLSLCFLRLQRHSDVYSILELSRAKVLSERISDARASPHPSANDAARELPDDVAVILYGNVDWGEGLLAVVLRQGSDVYVKEISDSLLSAQETKPYTVAEGEGPGESELALRGLRRKVSRAREMSSPDIYGRRSRVSSAVENYRRLLQKRDNTSGSLSSLSASLYRVLIEPIESQLQGIERLVIVPQGILGTLPFETLVDAEGDYLAERFEIGYVQSVEVWRTIKARSRRAQRRDLLALGGPEYDSEVLGTAMIGRGDLAETFRAAVASGSPLGPLYGSLGYGDWIDLPGTLDEVQKLSEIVADADVWTGLDASESRLKQESLSGRLAQYRTLHFAAHGVVVPELPELSAIVLAGSPFSPGEDDGYLRLSEIEQLHLEAEFVGLSACDTGLGRIYAGEGVVNLAQAFLIAGANGVAISLWQVADDATAKLMTEVYSMAESGISYSSALARAKRQFMRGQHGEEWRQPYYWAPFVYYGK